MLDLETVCRTSLCLRILLSHMFSSILNILYTVHTHHLSVDRLRFSPCTRLTRQFQLTVIGSLFGTRFVHIVVENVIFFLFSNVYNLCA